MATLISDAGVIDGQIVYAVHVTRIVDALTGVAQNTIIIDADLIQGNVNNTTNSVNSHAEGDLTDASGNYSHAEGTGTTSQGNGSHAEGNSTLSSGQHSHAEGNSTEASGQYSHAEGVSSVASGIGAHAEGYFTIAAGNYQTAVGQYNKAGNTTDYFVVGVGSGGGRLDGLGVNDTRTYISNSLFLPDLTNSSKPHVLAYDSTSKQVYFASTSSAAANAAPPDKAIQFNSGSTFKGSAAFIYDYDLNSLILGNHLVSATNTITFGSSCTSSGINSFTHGINNKSEGSWDFIIGQNNTSIGSRNFVAGINSSASAAVGAIALGTGVHAVDDSQVVVGKYNFTSSGVGIADDFIVGTGLGFSSRKNGFGINNTRAYISAALYLPELTNSNPGFVLSYNTASKQVNYIPNPSVTPPGGPNTAIQFNKNSTFSGSAKFTFDYNINRTNLIGSMIISGSSPTASLVLYGSGSSNPVFRVQGTQGELLVVTDVSSGSLFSVNDISGLPILDVYSDNTVLIGNYTYPSYHTSDFVTTAGAGVFKLGAIPTSSYDGGYFEYVVKSGSNARSGHITSTWDGTTVVSSSISSSDIGSTSGLTLFVALSSSYAVLSGSAPGAGWTIKSIIRAI